VVSVLSPNSSIAYKYDDFYDKDSEGGVLWNDEELNIDWKLPSDDIVLSDKDKMLPQFFIKKILVYLDSYKTNTSSF
jgi:dTDP-4-dehydrorhamnose 3,5-epimerase